MTRSTRSFWTPLLAVLAALAIAPPLAAQPPAAGAPPTGAPAGSQPPPATGMSQPAPGSTPARPAPGQAVAPPTVHFAREGISLDEAVRVTLQYEPTLQRQQSTVRFQEGVLQEQSGTFDYTFLGGIQYQHREQELSDDRKQSEIDKRTRLDGVIRDNATAAQRAQQLIPLLKQLSTSAPGQEPIAQLQAVDPSTASILQLFDDLISTNSTNPSVQADLIQARSDFINKSIGPDFITGLQDQINGYNDAVTARQNLGASPVDEVFYNNTINLQLSKLFRSGIQFAPFFDASRDGTNFVGKPQDSIFGGKGLKDQYLFHAGTGVTFPLLRGRGASSAAAFEKAAAIDADASRLNLQHQASASSLATMLAYWDLRAAQENVDIAKRSADLQSNLLRLTEQLINGGELPAAERSRAQAADARAQAVLEDAQRQLHQARVALAQAMGVAATGEDDTLPLARDPFPNVPDVAAVQSAPQLVEPAIGLRLDLGAAIKQQESGRVIENAAAFNLHSQLQLTTSTWYTALGQNRISRSAGRWVGPSAQLSLTLERPFGNNVLRGQLVQREADTRSREIAATDLQRQIRLGVVQASATLADAVAQVRQAEAAVGFYNNIYDADVQRYQTGEATLIDTVLTQQQQTEAMQALTAARRQLAQLLAQLRYQTGTLMRDGNVVSGPDLVTVPPVNRVPR